MSDILDAKEHNTWEGGKSFSLSNRIMRLFWIFTWNLLASWTPPLANPWRRFLLRAFGANLSPTAVIYSSVKIWLPRNLKMGDHACLGPKVNCYCMAPITLGNHSLVSQGAHLCAGTHDVSDPNFQLFAKPIEIDDYAWVAAEAFVGPGTNIAEGAVLGARGVAFKSLLPWTVYGGNPAQPLKQRNIRPGSGPIRQKRDQ